MEREMLLDEEKKEIEILEFQAGSFLYGADISDIQEILPYEGNIRKLPGSHPYIEGVIMPRDFVISVIDLKASLKLEDGNGIKDEMVIVTNINGMNIGFHVDNVHEIHRVTTADIAKPGRKLSTSVKGAVTGILNINNKKIEILDLRKIISNINPDIKFQ